MFGICFDFEKNKMGTLHFLAKMGPNSNEHVPGQHLNSRDMTFRSYLHSTKLITLHKVVELVSVGKI